MVHLEQVALAITCTGSKNESGGSTRAALPAARGFPGVRSGGFQKREAYAAGKNCGSSRCAGTGGIEPLHAKAQAGDHREGERPGRRPTRVSYESADERFRPPERRRYTDATQTQDVVRYTQLRVSPTESRSVISTFVGFGSADVAMGMDVAA